MHLWISHSIYRLQRPVLHCDSKEALLVTTRELSMMCACKYDVFGITCLSTAFMIGIREVLGVFFIYSVWKSQSVFHIFMAYHYLSAVLQLGVLLLYTFFLIAAIQKHDAHRIMFSPFLDTQRLCYVKWWIPKKVTFKITKSIFRSWLGRTLVYNPFGVSRTNVLFW